MLMDIPDRQTVNALFAEEPAVDFPFTDVKEGAWYYDAVKYVFENKIMIGTDDEHTVFSPNLEVNRATVVQILYNLEGAPEVSGTSNFTDLEEKDWFLEPVLWAEQLGIVNGYEDNTFRARNAVSREEFAKMLYNYAKYKGYDLGGGSRPDQVSRRREDQQLGVGSHDLGQRKRPDHRP